MEIDHRILLGVSLIALLISVFAYKEILDLKTGMCTTTPSPVSFEDIMNNIEQPDDDVEPSQGDGMVTIEEEDEEK
jgi:hypothetical protein